MKKKILVIDDSEQDRKIMDRFLNKAGFKDVMFAVNGEEGLKKIESGKPDLLIADTLLPDIDGFEVCRRARESSGSDLMKIIIVTGTIDAVNAVKAREMGADDYCAKTSDCAPLITAVNTLLKTE